MDEEWYIFIFREWMCVVFFSLTDTVPVAMEKWHLKPIRKPIKCFIFCRVLQIFLLCCCAGKIAANAFWGRHHVSLVVGVHLPDYGWRLVHIFLFKRRTQCRTITVDKAASQYLSDVCSEPHIKALRVTFIFSKVIIWFVKVIHFVSSYSLVSGPGRFAGNVFAVTPHTCCYQPTWWKNGSHLAFFLIFKKNSIAAIPKALYPINYTKGPIKILLWWAVSDSFQSENRRYMKK